MDQKETLHHYLRIRRDDLLGKLDGLSEYGVRRPLTPTGTNLFPRTAGEWAAHREAIESAARQA